MNVNIRQQRSTIGIAIGRDEIVGVRLHHRAAAPVRVPVTLRGTGEDAAALRDAFARLRTALDDGAVAKAESMGGALVSIALLPPLIDARIITLPPLRRAEAEAVLRRDAARHFVGVQAPHLVAVHTGERVRRNDTGGGTLAAAVSTSFVDAVAAAAASAGWQVHVLTPAHSAWASAAATVQGTGAYVAVAADVAHVIQLSGRRARFIRRVRAAAPGDIADAVADAGRVALFAPSHAASLEPYLAARITPASGDAHETAARYAEGDGIRFISPAAAEERSAHERRTALRLVMAAALLLLMAVVVDAWGARRELDVLRAHRAGIRAQVGPLLASRDSIDRITQHMHEIDARARSTPRWTPALFDIALMLPQQSHLTGLFANGDTLVIEAQGAGAGAALQALRSAGSLQDARLVGTVERELDGGATSVERFRLSARLAAPAADAHARATRQEGAEP